MFNKCESLQNNLDLSSFDYNSVIKMKNKISINKYEILSSDYANYDLSFKIIIIGDSDSGKSTLVAFGTKDIFEENYSPTLRFEFKTFNVKIKDKAIKLQIWDTCGQEMYRTLISSFYYNSSLAIIVYAINNIKTFNDVDYWIRECKLNCSPGAKLFLVGNKIGVNEYE